MPGKPPLLSLGVGVIAKTPFLLQMENECPDFFGTYPGNVGIQAVAAEEIIQISYAAGDDGYGVWAFTFGGSTQLVTMKQTSYIGAKIRRSKHSPFTATDFWAKIDTILAGVTQR